MTLVRRHALPLILFVTMAGVSPAFAADEPAVVAAILKNWESQLKVKPTYQAVSAESDGSVVVDGLAVSLPMQGDPAGGKVTLTFGKTKLSGITDKGNGLFEVANAQFSDTKFDIGSAAGSFVVTIPQGSAEYMYIKALGDNPTPNDVVRANLNVARKMSSGPITLAAAGQTFTADGYQMTWDGDPVTGAGKTEFKLSNIAIPETAIAALDPTGTLKKLGYSSLSFDIGGNGNVDIKTEKMGFDFDVFYAGKDMGTLKVGAGAGEIPAALFAELTKLEGQAQPDPSKFLPLIEGIQISRVLFRFEDKSITKKVLPMLAAMQGMDEATMVANTGAMLQLSLASLNNQAFTQKAVDAVNAYLKDPQSLTILAKPAQPVTVQQLMALDPNNPGAAIDQLGLTISAND